MIFERVHDQLEKIIYTSSTVLINFGRLSGLIFPDIFMLVFLFFEGPVETRI